MARNNTLPLAEYLENGKLQESGTNFVDWYHGVKIVLKGNEKDYVLEATLGDTPDENAMAEVVNKFQTRSSDYIIVQSTILVAMEPGLQKKFENWGPYETIVELQSMFMKQVRSERFALTQALLSCKMEEGSPVFDHVWKMHGYVLRLEALDAPWSTELFIDLILTSLPPSFDDFVADYNVHGMNETLPEFFTMLRVYEMHL